MNQEPAESISDVVNLNYKAVFENGPALYLILKPDSPNFTIVTASKSFLEVTHTTLEEITDRSLFEIFPDNPGLYGSKNEKNLRRVLDKVLISKKPHNVSAMRYDIATKDSEEFISRYWTICNTPVLDEEGEIEYIINSPTDVTDVIKMAHEEKLAHDAVESQRSQLYSLFMQAPVAIGIFKGPDYIVELVNPPLCNLYGKTEDELFGQPIFDVLTEASNSGIEQILDNVLYTGEPYVGVEVPIPLLRHGKRDIVYCNFVYEPLHEPDGSISGVIAVATDVTEQVHNRQQLEESENRLAMALEAATLGVWDLDVKNDTVTTNQHYAQIFGFSDPTFVWPSNTIYQHVISEDQEVLRQSVKQAFFETGKLNVPIRIEWPDKSMHWIHIIGTVYYNAKKEPLRMLGTVQDITERKEQERHKDEFISTVSHELKTPVTSLKAFCQVLQRKFDKSGNPLAAEMLTKMNMQINRLNLVIQDLLDVTRIEGNKIQFRHSLFSFNELLKEIVEEVQRTSETHTIVAECIEQDIQLYGDQERIGQVLTNLLTNAVKYSPGKDMVLITVKIESDQLICLVKDFGLGIPMDKQQHIFERFFRVESENLASGSGLGLGLYISAEIIKRQNGKIWMESQPGEGSTFYFSLPLHKEI
jgi:two-component system, OmpR family, sensor histidine kinase VicK